MTTSQATCETMQAALCRVAYAAANRRREDDTLSAPPVPFALHAPLEALEMALATFVSHPAAAVVEGYCRRVAFVQLIINAAHRVAALQQAADQAAARAQRTVGSAVGSSTSSSAASRASGMTATSARTTPRPGPTPSTSHTVRMAV
eukprot:5232996-Prymnesium_polylepis.1